MKRRVKLLQTLCKKYGLLKGAKSFIGFNFGKIHKVEIPNIQHPLYLRYQSSDIETFHQVFIHDEYKIDIPFEPKIIIDGGANIGLYAIKMKNDFPEAKIICIEPDLENFDLLKTNLANYKNIFFENCGLWNKTTLLKIFDKFNLGKWGMVVEEDEEKGNIKTISINHILKKYQINQIDILKLDIETSEKYLFADNFKSWLPKVKMIIIELHDFMETGCAKPFFDAITSTLTNYKYLVNGENTIIINLDLIESKLPSETSLKDIYVN